MPEPLTLEQLKSRLANETTLLRWLEVLRRAGYDIMAATQTAYNQFKPGIDELARCLAATYADTVYATAGFNDLKAALSGAGGGWDPATVDCVSSSTLKSWNGLSLRKMLGDAGLLPCAGVVTVCPDIIPNGRSTVGDLNTFYATWNTYPGQRVDGAAKNYIYVRGVNRYPGNIDGKVYLYWVDSTILQDPSRWHPLKTQDGNDHVTVSANNLGDIFVGSQPFIWEPPQRGSHYCLVARIETDFFANPLPPGTISDIFKWIAAQPAVGWHNVDTTLLATAGTKELVLTYGNTDPQPNLFLISAVASNLPEGTTLRLRSKEGNVSFDTGEVTMTGPHQEAHIDVKLPGNYSGTLSVLMTTPVGATELQPGSMVNVQFFARIQTTHPAARFAQRPSGFGFRAAVPALSSDEKLAPLGNFVLLGRI